MIEELLDLADRLDIPTPRAIEPMPVHYVIDLSLKGEILGITPAYGSDGKSGDLKHGKVMDCPVYFPLKIKEKTSDEIQATGGGGKSVAEAGHGDIREIFCVEIKGTPPRPVCLDKKQHYRHEGWLTRLNEFIEDKRYYDLNISKALRQFIAAKYPLNDSTINRFFSLPDPAKAGSNASSPEEKRKAMDKATKERNAQLKKIANNRFTFRIEGQLLLKNWDFRNWWEKTYADERNRILDVLPEGEDGFSYRTDDGSKRLTPVFPHIPNVPRGGSYCPLASFDKATTRSFGLAKHTLSMSITTAERTSAALKQLLQDENSHCSLGKDLVAIFWAVPLEGSAKPCAHDFTAWLDEPDALQVLNFFHNIHGHSTTAPDTSQFYCAILSSPKSRITVRNWHTDTLDAVTKSAEKYFEAVSLPDILDTDQIKTSTLDNMAWATISKTKKQKNPAFPHSVFRLATDGII